MEKIDANKYMQGEERRGREDSSKTKFLFFCHLTVFNLKLMIISFARKWGSKIKMVRK